MVGAAVGVGGYFTVGTTVGVGGYVNLGTGVEVGLFFLGGVGFAVGIGFKHLFLNLLQLLFLAFFPEQNDLTELQYFKSDELPALAL